jgi:anthranilate phosphoribosyltransferase
MPGSTSMITLRGVMAGGTAWIAPRERDSTVGWPFEAPRLPAESYPKPVAPGTGRATLGQPMTTPPLDTMIDLAGWTADLAAGRRRSRADVERLVAGVLDGSIDLDAFGRWLVTLADLGESAAEIAGVAAALRTKMLPVTADAIVADTCGTGGDGSGSFNISTAAAIVVAAAGQPVAKHGNRAVSSKTGSADVLEALGVKIDAGVEHEARCLREIGLCFCLAPLHHPAMARVGPLRRSLGRPTVFNLVGPLCNPAGATVQVIGVGRPASREPMAEAARWLGAKRALIVSGHVGSEAGPAFDEVSLFGPTDVIDVAETATTRSHWTPEDFGLATQPAARLAELEVAGPAESAAAIRSVLAGELGPRRDVVVLNAAALLWAAGKAADPPAAAAVAAAAIDSGRAAALLAQLATASHAGS